MDFFVRPVNSTAACPSLDEVTSNVKLLYDDIVSRVGIDLGSWVRRCMLALDHLRPSLTHAPGGIARKN
jgi:hypothetical protein